MAQHLHGKVSNSKGRGHSAEPSGNVLQEDCKQSFSYLYM